MTEISKVLTPLKAPVPPQLEAALGYQGDARFVAFYWSPAGDEVMYDDGWTSGDGDWWSWLAYVDHPAVAPYLWLPCPRCRERGTTNTLYNDPCITCDGAGLLPLNLGSSDYNASEWLILDRQERKVLVAPVATARRFLEKQWPPLPELTPEAEEALSEAIQKAIKELSHMWQPPSNEELQTRLLQTQQVFTEMVAWLDGQIKERDTRSLSSSRREE